MPKEKMSEIVTYLNDISETKEQGKNFWSRWLDRFAAYYDEKFGPDLKDKEKKFLGEVSI